MTRSETVPSMQRLYAVMLRIRRLNATFVSTFNIYDIRPIVSLLAFFNTGLFS